MTFGAALSRRSVLGLAALGLAGCKHGSSPSAPRVDPDAAALLVVSTHELLLLAATTDPTERSLHMEHLAALNSPMPPGPTPTPMSVGSIRPLLRQSITELRENAVAAVSGSRAAVFASIAASHEVMLDD